LETRIALLEIKIPADQLQIPEWLTERERELSSHVDATESTTNDQDVSQADTSGMPL
jgi:hypothetical protein